MDKGCPKQSLKFTVGLWYCGRSSLIRHHRSYQSPSLKHFTSVGVSLEILSSQEQLAAGQSCVKAVLSSDAAREVGRFASIDFSAICGFQIANRT